MSINGISPILALLTLAGILVAYQTYAGNESTNKKFINIAGSGLLASCRSHTLALGDYNGDGFDDITLTSHTPLLWLRKNNGNNTFSKIVLNVKKMSDTHGMAFADFDNDGDQDLLQTTGGALGVGGISGQLWGSFQKRG